LSKTDPELLPLLNRIAAALERLAPPHAPHSGLDAGDAITVPPGASHGFAECSPDFEFLDVRVG